MFVRILAWRSDNAVTGRAGWPRTAVGPEAARAGLQDDDFALAAGAGGSRAGAVLTGGGPGHRTSALRRSPAGHHGPGRLRWSGAPDERIFERPRVLRTARGCSLHSSRRAAPKPQSRPAPSLLNWGSRSRGSATGLSQVGIEHCAGAFWSAESHLRPHEGVNAFPEFVELFRHLAIDGLPGTGPWVTRPVRGPKGPVAQVPPGLPVETSRRTDEPGATGSAPPRG